MLLLLEPDSEKARRFQEVMQELDPGGSAMTWRNARVMIRELPARLEAAALISLDHDLPPGPDGAHPGEGLDVARFLASQPIIRPVIIHSSNKACATMMAAEFERAGWPYSLVPHVGSDWIEIGWKRAVRRLLRMTLSKRLPMPTRTEYQAASRRRFIYGVLCLIPFILCLVVIVHYLTRETPRPVASPSERDLADEPRNVVKPVSPIADRTPDFILPPEDFSKELRTSKTAAAEKYRGKVIQLTGVVNKYLNTFGKVMLCMDAGYILDINCYTTDPEPWAAAVPGQQVTLKGRFPDSFILTELHDCVILKVTGENRTTFLVTELARAYASDPRGFMEEYYDTCLILTGVVESRTEDEGVVGNVHVAFKTDSNVKVIADFSKWNHDADRLRLGQAVRIVGRFSGDRHTGPGVLNLGACIYAGRAK